MSCDPFCQLFINIGNTVKAYRQLSDFPPKRRAKALLGRGLKTLLPKLAQRVHERPFHPRWGIAGRLIRNGHLADAVESRDHETLQRFFTDYWSSETSAEFYDQFAQRFEDLFLRFHAGIVDRIADATAHFGPGSARLVEVGCGDGRVHHYMARHLPGIGEFHGIDLNATQIANCRITHRDTPNFHFHAENLVSWIAANPAAGTIFVTNGGVLEYLLRRQLVELFENLRSSCSPCLIAITETVAIDHDLSREVESIPYGHEFAFSHNYQAILQEAGFETRWKADRFTEPGEENHPARWFQLIASA